MVVENGKKYMVYLLNSPYSKNQPDAWLCGGVLVSTKHVLTSAACLTEVSHIYVIAGYKKYVSGDKIKDDECTWTRKQRIVKIVIPKAYNQSTWMQYDVGLGVVEKPYNFFDLSYRTVCSHEPEAIKINYNPRMEAPISYVVALGWGAAKARKPGMVADINSEYLMQAQAIITNTSYCRQQFPKNVEYLFLCTHGLNDVVKIRVIKKEIGIISSNTSNIQRKIISSTTSKNQRHIFSSTTSKNKKKKISSTTSKNQRKIISSTTSKNQRKIISSKPSSTGNPVRYKTGWRCGGKQITSKETPAECVDMASTELDIIDSMRKRGVPGKYFGGICQNDHGGPLIAFAGEVEVVVGVALNSVYDKKYECEGPFLYLSTARSVNLLKCLFTSDKEMRKKCYSMNYERIEYYVDWPSEEETSKSYGYGKDQSTVRPLRPVKLVRPIPVRPRPNFYKELLTRPNFNIGLAYKRPK